MSALDSMRESFVRLTETQTPDGCGGFTRAWAEGDAFEAALLPGSAGEKTDGQVLNEHRTFTVVVDSGVRLCWRGVFRRVRDGAVFRMTSDTAGSAAPGCAGVAIAKGNCERWDFT